MPSYTLLHGKHSQRGMTPDGGSDCVASVTYEEGETFWSPVPLTDTNKFEPVASTYEYGVDDGGLSQWVPADMYDYFTNIRGLDLSPLTGSSPQQDLADAIAALVDA